MGHSFGGAFTEILLDRGLGPRRLIMLGSLASYAFEPMREHLDRLSRG